MNPQTLNPRALFLALAGLAVFAPIATAADRYEAESAIVDENSVQKIADTAASGGFLVNMKEGTLAFKVTPAAAGYYTLMAAYSQPNDVNGKIQNLSVNGSSKGQIAFPYTVPIILMKASAKIKLEAGVNTISIEKSWGWVSIDYVEVRPYVETPFSIAPGLVSPNPSENARRVYGFLRQNFRKKVVSGFMTNNVMQTDGKYTPMTVQNQTESAWIREASGKTPALIGLDFMHATGLNSNGEWYQGYTKATLALAEDMFKQGGIPAYCWHWKDPGLTVERFYSPSSGNPFTDFNLNKAFLDSTTAAAWNTASPEYQGIIRDLDIIAGHLKTLADKGVPVLWRPVHEASGKWFWWGYRGSKACKALYKLMFDRFTGMHGLNNLIWVWTSDEAGDALDWYPGDAYADIIGRDYYYYPRLANHGSLVASFEKLKDLFGGAKLIALSENGSVPYADSMQIDGAGWSYFMPWYGDYTMDGWAHDNTAADWKAIMNHAYTFTLDQMPGWADYPVQTARPGMKAPARPVFSVRYAADGLELTLSGGGGARTADLLNLRGIRIATLHADQRDVRGDSHFKIKDMLPGAYLVKAGSACIPISIFPE
jgi:mannan endo-1,4-beta-mannosidase